MIFFPENSLQNAVRQFLDHYRGKKLIKASRTRSSIGETKSDGLPARFDAANDWAAGC